MTYAAPPPMPRATADDRRALGELLGNGPLYGRINFSGTWLDNDTLDKVLPEEIRRHCEPCGHPIGWIRTGVSPCSTDGHATAGYVCRGCGARFEVMFTWTYGYTEEEDRAFREARLAAATVGAPAGPAVVRRQGAFEFRKVGQSPAPTIVLPAELEKALGNHATHYRRGMVCRNQNFGIGALGYFRRIVEETMDDMLDLLLDALKVRGATPETIAAVEAAKAERVFETKVKVASDALPDELRPGGFNPFGSLHQIYSRGLHGLSDEECVDMVDEIREDVEIIFKTLKTHIEDRTKYAEAVKRIQGKRRGKASFIP